MKYENVAVIVLISLMLICDASVVVEYDRTRPRLCNAVINMKYDNYSCYRNIAIAISLNVRKTDHHSSFIILSSIIRQLRTGRGRSSF